MARSKSSQQWMQEHFQDEYVKKAQAMGLRSRAVFKLMEIQEKDREDEVLQKLYKVLDNQDVHLLLSDMAPNMSGNKEVDQPRSIYLGELALDAAQAILVKGGTFLIKMFQGEGFDAFCNQVKMHFTTVVIRKPKASRSRSNEVYILAKGFK